MPDSVDQFGMPRPAERPVWRWWFAALVAGLAVFLATESPAAGAILPALAAGRKLFCLGLRILNHDSNRIRARVCFAFYFAAAFWKAAATAFVSALGFVVIQSATGERPANEVIAATMMTLAGGVVLNTLIGLGAIFAAVRYRIRVWVHSKIQIPFGSELETACEIESTRAHDLKQFRLNHAVFVVATAMTLPVVGLGCGVLAGLVTGEAANQVSPFTIAVGMGIVIGGTFAMIPFYGWLSSRIVATTPQECWPAGDLEV